MQPIIITDASPEDADEIVHIQAETWLATYPNEKYGITREDILGQKLDDPIRIDRWRTGIKNDTETEKTFVAKKDSHVVGYCLAKKGDTENYIQALYVASSEQGKGIGQKLMSAVESWLDPSKPTGLGVVTYNEQAVGFYKKLGYEISDEPPEPIRPLASGKILPTIKMIKRNT